MIIQTIDQIANDFGVTTGNPTPELLKALAAVQSNQVQQSIGEEMAYANKLKEYELRQSCDQNDLDSFLKS